MQRPFTMVARINGHPADMLIDTGSYESILTTTAVTRLGLYTEHLLDDVEVPDGFNLRGVGGRRHYDRTTAENLDMPGLQKLGVPFAALWSGYAPWGVDGVFGMALLGEYDLDLHPEQVTLLEPATSCRAGFTGLPLQQPGQPGVPLIRATLDGHAVAALLDTGAERSILFAPQSWWQHGAAAADIVAEGVGPRPVPASIYRARLLRVGDISLQNMPIVAVAQTRPADAALILGMDFFRHVHVIISAPTGMAWLRQETVRGKKDVLF